jgi:hypothetical protein
LVKLNPSEPASPTAAIDQADWETQPQQQPQQQQEVDLQAAARPLLPWAEDQQSGPPQTSLAAPIAAGEGLRSEDGTAGYKLEAGATSDAPHQRHHMATMGDTEFAEATGREEDTEEEGTLAGDDGDDDGDDGDDLLLDMEVLAELLGDSEGAGQSNQGSGLSAGQQRGKALDRELALSREKPAMQGQDQQQQQQGEVVGAGGSWSDWRTAEPSQMQQYGEMLQGDDAATAAAAGEGGRVAAGPASTDAAAEFALAQSQWKRATSTAAAGGGGAAAAGGGRGRAATALGAAGGGGAAAAAIGAAGQGAAAGSGPPTYGLTLAVFVYCVPASLLKRLLFELQLPVACVRLVTRVSDADVVLHCLPQPGQRHFQYDAVSRGVGSGVQE